MGEESEKELKGEQALLMFRSLGFRSIYLGAAY